MRLRVGIVLMSLISAGCANAYLRHPVTGDTAVCETHGYHPLPVQLATRESCVSELEKRGFKRVDRDSLLKKDDKEPVK